MGLTVNNVYTQGLVVIVPRIYKIEFVAMHYVIVVLNYFYFFVEEDACFHAWRLSNVPSVSKCFL